jgi:hypothetical protein
LFFQGPIYSPTAAANYNSFEVFEEAKKYIPARRCGTPEEVSFKTT